MRYVGFLIWITLSLFVAACFGPGGDQPPQGASSNDASADVRQRDTEAVPVASKLSAGPHHGEPRADVWRPSLRSEIVGWGELRWRSERDASAPDGGPAWEVVFAPLPGKVVAGDSVTLVAMQAGHEAVNVRVGHVERKQVCGPDDERWIVDRLPLRRPGGKPGASRAARHVKIAIVAPAVASPVRLESVGRRLPVQVDPRTLELVLDVTGDEKADLMSAQYCCDDPTLHPDSAALGCLTCSKAYRWNASSWTETAFVGPC